MTAFPTGVPAPAEARFPDAGRCRQPARTGIPSAPATPIRGHRSGTNQLVAMRPLVEFFNLLQEWESRIPLTEEVDNDDR